MTLSMFETRVGVRERRGRGFRPSFAALVMEMLCVSQLWTGLDPNHHQAVYQVVTFYRGDNQVPDCGHVAGDGRTGPMPRDSRPAATRARIRAGSELISHHLCVPKVSNTDGRGQGQIREGQPLTFSLSRLPSPSRSQMQQTRVGSAQALLSLCTTSLTHRA